MNTADLIRNLVYLAVAVYVLYGIYRLVRRVRPSRKNAPVLLAAATRGEAIDGGSGITPAGYPYHYLVGSDTALSRSVSTGVMSVSLPFQTKAHLVGVPNRYEDVEVELRGSVMEPVHLEGNYSDVFHLYADKQQQVESRYVLDPKAMVFTMDFCANAHWEIVRDTLYFVSKNELPSFEVVDHFVREIRPALQVASERGAAQLPYHHGNNLSLNCPICNDVLIESETWLQCPRRHGVLMSGKALTERRKNPTAAPDLGPVIDDRREVLVCPYCSGNMIEHHFQGTSTKIDICNSCVYRWIDAKETPTVIGYSFPPVI